MIKVDLKEIKRFESDLKAFQTRAYPFATKETLNRSAFQARANGQEIIKKKMVLRNRYILNSVRVDPARTLKVRNQAAVVGSTAPELEDQEFGAIKTKRGSEGIPIPTSYSAGQGQNVKPRTRLPRKANKLSSIKLRKRGKRGISKKQKNIIAIKEAIKTKRKFVYLELKRRRGLFKIVGGKRKARIKMVYDLSNKVVKIPRNPWLLPAVNQVKSVMLLFYRESLIFQLKRHRIFTDI